MTGHNLLMPNPQEATTGTASITLRLELAMSPHDDDTAEHIRILEPLLISAVNDSATAELTGVRCRDAISGATAPGQFAIFLFVTADMDRWNRELGGGEHTPHDVVGQLKVLLAAATGEYGRVRVLDILPQLIVA